MAKNLREMQVYSGSFDTNALQRFYKFIFKSFGERTEEVTELVMRFITEQLAKSTEKVTESGIWSYIDRLADGVNISSYPKFLRRTSTHGSLAYFLASNLLPLKESYGLEYFMTNDKTFYSYFFFDPEIEEFVGVLEISRTMQLPYNSYKVILSSVEKEYIGRGYGSRMYVTVLDKVDYLKSDESLYTDSLNIWVNFLPKVSKVWAKLSEEDKFIEVNLSTHTNPELVDFYLASKKRIRPPK